MNLGEKYKQAWFDYKDNVERETLPSLIDDNFEFRSLTKGPPKAIESKADILERLSQIGATVKTTPEVHFSSDDILVMSVLQEWDGGKGIVMVSVIFKNNKAVQMIATKGDPWE